MPDLKVIPCSGVPNQDLIERLEAHLAEAKSGRLVGMAFAGALNNGETVTDWSSCHNWHALNSALAVLQFRLIENRRQKPAE